NWPYGEKGLFLASSLAGNARSILTELSPAEIKDYDILLSKLNARFGSKNRADVFRTQLKTKVRAKGESIQDLAQSIRNLTRKAYPNAASAVTDVIALDHFIDAVNDSSIRIRLRELNLTNITEAEEIATKMEAYRISDSQRHKFVAEIANSQNAPNTTTINKDGQMSQLFNILENLSKKLDKCIDKQTSQTPGYQYRANSHQYPSRDYRNHETFNNRYRGGNSTSPNNQSTQNSASRRPFPNEQFRRTQPENETASNWRSADRRQ
ncbi:MAG: hypothetical protein ABW185_26110, partial [Sedimenticola sp.]